MNREVIRSRDNALFKSLIKLEASPRERHGASRTLLDGEHLIQAYRDAGLGQIDVIAAGESALEREALRTLFESAPAKRRAVLADKLLSRLSQVASSAGLLAVVFIPEGPPMPSAIGDALLLERIQDPGNLGSILRSAQAAGLREVFLSPGTALAWSPKTVRAGMGAHFRLHIHENADIEAVSRLATGRIIATGAHAGLNLYEADLRGPVTWLFGNEGAGLSRVAASAASQMVAIPMPGQAESLNVAASVAVCLFEQVRQRLETKRREAALSRIRGARGGLPPRIVKG